MTKEFCQVDWDAALIDDCRQLIQLAVREDLDCEQDWTTVALVAHDAQAQVSIVAREAGILAGLPIVELTIEQLELNVRWTPEMTDGNCLEPNSLIGALQGNVRDLLTSERIILNFLGRLCGIATLTRKYVKAVSSTNVRIYDTRKTTPGWRRLEKYAVRQGGGTNHRVGLFAAAMAKDNHLAWFKQAGNTEAELKNLVPAIRSFLESHLGQKAASQKLVEIEVDTIVHLQEVLPSGPDIVLLDNMSLEELRSAISLRDEIAPEVQLEASGGVNLNTVQQIAETGVDRISVGALTHSASSLDIGLDWFTQ
ncbi:MAG: carboxylating nicotinate-nucleotide diphosphorylase [Pirellulales bacterium]|jgi:nicotinate-nucleotide pyrophosphorylase (carboxylating)